MLNVASRIAISVPFVTAVAGEMRERLGQDGRWQGEFWLRNKEGEAFADKVVRVRLNDRTGVTGYLTLSQDVVGSDDQQRLMLWQAHHDTLTKLPNRNLFNDRLQQALKNAERAHQKLAILFIDLDGIKGINDHWGHDIGDRLLQIVAYRLTECLRRGDTVARIGGDEFPVLLPGLKRIESVFTITEKILNSLRQPFLIAGDHPDAERFTGDGCTRWTTEGNTLKGSSSHHRHLKSDICGHGR